jgi:hypothetical protein
MTGPGRTLRTLAIVVVALAVNLAVDVAFDLPVVVRWAIAVAAVLLLLRLLDRRRSEPRGDADEQRRVPPPETPGPGHPHAPHPFGGGPVDRGERLSGG